MTDRERERLREAHENSQQWYRWGPYLAERQWSTVREDYSADGNAWASFPHDQARSRTYRWGEDGLLGMSDDQGLLCFALALWNGNDPILKERLFGLTNAEGNHGEDVKEAYYFLDNTPTHSYMKALYKYPQRAFPYGELVAENQRRGKEESEYELIDTGIFAENRYFDVTIEYAKIDANDILVRINATNRGPEAAPLHILPTLWFRNTWSWDNDDYRPELQIQENPPHNTSMVRITHHKLGEYWLACEGAPRLLFTENETNAQRLWGAENRTPFVKDGINDTIVNHAEGRINPENKGTKAAAHYEMVIAPGATSTIQLRLSAGWRDNPFADAWQLFSARQQEADEFYRAFGASQTEDSALVQRQALAGLLWSKQFYSYDVDRWLQGDPAGPQPPARERNSHWRHLSNADIILMPDTWEYPWYAAWDLAFHCIAMSLVDSEFAKEQLLLMLHERYMHPNGQLPAYEWAFSDVNPPVHAWAAWKIYQQEKATTGYGDRAFLERVFQKLMLNFTWWVNRKDQEENNIFEGGFLGMDNIGLFDRNMRLPNGALLEQSDGTAWMAMFCLNLNSIAMELAQTNSAYEEISNKLLDHFMYIADAINTGAGNGPGLWDEEDGFFYDRVCLPDGTKYPLKARSLVGFIPLLAMCLFDTHETDQLLAKRLEWFVQNRPYVPRLRSTWQDLRTQEERREYAYSMLALVRGPRLRSLLNRLLDPQEFLSPYGIRSLSKQYEEHPYALTARGITLSLQYTPAESNTEAFGGNSNWRGPIWFPINYLLIDALREYHRFYGDSFQVACPTGSGQQMTLGQVADELTRRLASIFLRNEQGQRPVFGPIATLQNDPCWRDAILFYEYFNGDNGAGIGANHQTGWTAVIANLLEQTRVNTVSEKQPVGAMSAH